MLAAAPAADGAVVEQCAGVLVAGRDRDRLPPGAEVDRPDRARSLVVPDHRRVPVPQRAVCSVAPAAHGSVGEHHTGVGATRVEKARGQATNLRRGLLRARARNQGQRDEGDQKRRPPHLALDGSTLRWHLRPSATFERMDGAKLTRRGSIVGFGGPLLGLLGWKAVDQASGAGPAAVASGAVSCVLAPEQTEGRSSCPATRCGATSPKARQVSR